jgi:hypothetical protein
MKQKKDNFNDLSSQVQQLNEKYQIKNFTEEIKTVFRTINIDEKNIESFLNNPSSGMYGYIYPLDNVDQKQLADCISEYKKLKKKYNYNSYVREGHALRKNFLQQRKNYIFNSSKFIRFTTSGKMSPLERLNVDYAEQQFIAKWVEKLLKKIYPNTLIVEYETSDGSTKSAELQYRKIEITKDFVEAPLIDRVFGENLFDTFLLKSFYNVQTNNYEYFPVKFIINMRAKDHPMFFEE